MKNGKIPRRSFPPGPEGTKAYWQARNQWTRDQRTTEHQAALAERKAKEYARKKRNRRAQQAADNRVRARRRLVAAGMDPGGTNYRIDNVAIEDIKRHLRKGRDIGTMAVYMGTPVSQVVKAVAFVKALNAGEKAGKKSRQ